MASEFCEREKRSMSSEFCEREKRSREDMIMPPGYFFHPTDEQLLIHYLKRKSEALTLPCDIVFERDIYGVSDKAPWQIFTEEDPWTEHTVYVLTRLIKVSKKGSRVARTAGCGSWVAETGPKNIKHKGAVIGSKKMLTFRINNDSDVKDKQGVRTDHWIMHEYSLGDGKSSTSGEGEYVLCKITNKSAKEVNEFGDGSVADDHNIVPNLSKRARLTEFVPEKKTDRDDISTELQTEVVCPLEDQFLQEPGPVDDIMFGLEELGVVWEEELVRSGQTAAISNASNFHTAARYSAEPEPLVEAEELQQGFPFDCDRFGYISSSTTTEVLHSGFASVPVPENVLPPKSTFHYDCDQYLNNLERFECGEDLSNTTEILSSAELLLPGCQESNGFLLPNSRFDATTDSLPTISLVSNNMHVQLDPKIIWGLKNMSWPESNYPQCGYGGEINVP